MKMTRKTFRRTTLITLGLTAFLLGIGASRRLDGAMWLVVVPLVILFISAKSKNIVTLVALVALGFSLGLWRGTIYKQKIQIYSDLHKTPVILVGIADTDAVYGEKSQLTFDMRSAMLVDPWKQNLVGKLSIKGFGAPMIYKGDTVQVEGKLYQTRGSKQAAISFAELAVLDSSTSKIDRLRRDFAAGMTSALPEPLGSFGLGLLIGQRTTLPKTFTEQLSAVGLTHIVAVSGYNLTIIVLAVHRLLSRRSKYQSALATVSLIAVFLLFTGASASIVRAALVSFLGLIAWYYGRSFKPLLLILLAAALTAGWYPLYMWSDLGWYLSFLAFFGILLLAPLLQKRVFKKKPRLLAQLLVETTAAQIMTLPLIMYIFGNVSVISILANVLIVPFVPLAMLFCLIAGLGGMIFAPLAGWVAWPARFMLTYMVDTVQLLSRVPYALVERSVSLLQMLGVYGIISFVVATLWKKTPKNATLTDRNQSTHIGVS